MKVNIKNSFSVDLETKLTAKELFVISVALQKLKRMMKEEISKEIEYYSKFIEEDKIKDIAKQLHSDMYNTLRGLEVI